MKSGDAMRVLGVIGLAAMLGMLGCRSHKPSGNEGFVVSAMENGKLASEEAPRGVVATEAHKEFVGFDRNDYPGDGRLAELRKSFAFAGYWLNAPPGETATTWTGKRQAMRDAGFGFLVLWNGRLEAEILAASKAKAGMTPAVLGARDAAAAVAAAGKEGFPKGAVIFLDQEEGGRLTEAQAGYFFAWTEGVAASAYRPGAYLSGEQSPDGTGPDGKPVTITTAADVREHVRAGKLHEVVLWVYDDTCPPAPGCTLHDACARTAAGRRVRWLGNMRSRRGGRS